VARGIRDGSPRKKRLGLRLLGPPEASLEGLPVRFRIKKELALLCYLAAEWGKHPSRELAELLWPESEERRARADLRAVLHKLRKTLGEDTVRDGAASIFIIDGDRLGLEPRGIEVDLEALEAAISLARRNLPGWKRKQRHHRRRTPGAHRASARRSGVLPG
jgi:DNA-binding SARP family transcriptional activator